MHTVCQTRTTVQFGQGSERMFGFNQGSRISDSYVKNRSHTHMAMKMLAHDLLDTGVFLKDLTGAF